MSISVQNDPASPPAEHTALLSVIDPVFTGELLRGLAVALPAPERQTDEQAHIRTAAALVALRSFDAQEPAEAMLATHAVLAHHFTMECYRRAARSSNTSNLNTRLLGTASVLSRLMTGTLRALEQRQQPPVLIGKPGAP